ncbi:hypothetical protein ALC57_05682 [Trachymyrmex cornetzi]|uniref:Uncharacterized protein n=1 Tax=Trachymyrmex cornetzi TaxID=471704 RepID=A0A151JA82_9HYME|nr:hypothetical protein ALC57_05682 [Trachymyrmex cornetzi]
MLRLTISLCYKKQSDHIIGQNKISLVGLLILHRAPPLVAQNNTPGDISSNNSGNPPSFVSLAKKRLVRKTMFFIL